MTSNDIQGTVLDQDGDPVSGVSIGLFLASPPSDVIYTTTDSNGEYIFTEHPQATGLTQEWVVTCAHDDGASRFHTISKPYVTASLSPPPETTGEVIATSPGTYSFTVPQGVTNISAVAVGGGGGGGGNNGSSGPGSAAGGGGGLGWANNISVSQGETIDIVVGSGGSAGTPSSNPSSGGESYIEVNNIRVVEAFGGGSGTSNSSGASGGSGGGFSGDGGGSGGQGGPARNNSSGSGGGGAGGYSGSGGDENSDGSGGGGYGGRDVNGRAPGFPGQGGGVGIFGEGTPPDRIPSNVKAGNFGGGGAGVEDDTNANGGIGGDGGVRIIFGDNRAFPTTNVDQESSDGNITTLRP